MGLILVRYGEIALKGGNQRFFLKRLRDNIKDCLRKHGLSGAVSSVRGRIYVETDRVEQALACLQRVFGIVSLSPAVSVSPDLLAIQEVALKLAREAGLDATRSFRVQARRTDKTFPFTSPEIKHEVGAYIQRALGSRVDLSDEADVTIGIEVRWEGSLVYGETVRGPGGLPLNTAGRAVALLSGGIDSPVAAWMMMRRGCGVIPLHFQQSDAGAEKALANCDVLASWSYGWDIRPIVLEHEGVFGATYRKLHRLGAARWTCIFCKRTLLLKACEIAEEHKARALVTGENLGQVASQTLENLEAISYGVPKPIMRPLIAFDKAETMNLAKQIGTFEISTRDSPPCPYLPEYPITTGRMSAFREILAAVEGEDAADPF